MRLRQYGLSTAQLAISLRYLDGRRWKDVREITPTQDVLQLTAVMSSMLACLPAIGTPLKVSLALNKVAPIEAIPQPMFQHVGPSRNALNESLDAINKKYGKNTIYLGPAWNALSSAPMRIAFNHIPDLEVDDDE
jgi:DNA polymerase-4